MSTIKKPLTYADAGVDIDAGSALIERIKPIAKKTQRPEVMTGLGGFGGLFALPIDRYRQPILVSGTDGVGSKLKLAIETGIHDTIGIDLVAMCVNDVIVCGAEPLFFLDYYATGKLDLEVAESVIRGIGTGCQQAGMALIGGETAEMPGLYAAKDYDLAGFCVGIVERDAMIDGKQVQPGNALIGLPSSGIHANGYSLVRKVLHDQNIPLTETIDNSTLAQTLLTPTVIYAKALLTLQQQVTIHAIAHITGGGLLENIPRVLPEHCKAEIATTHWPSLPIFNWLQEVANIETREMQRTFNCGIGMVICIPAEQAELALATLSHAGQPAYLIGQISERKTEEPHVIL